jgi:hypothetical protein
MLCIWWDMDGHVPYELLERNLTVTAERYFQQLLHLEGEIQQKRLGRRHRAILQHDNARPHTHTANMTKVAIQELDWVILPCAPYSPDLAPSDYHLCHSLSNNLCGVSFNNDTKLQNWLDDFFTARPAISSSVGSKTCPSVGRGGSRE